MQQTDEKDKIELKSTTASNEEKQMSKPTQKMNHKEKHWSLQKMTLVPNNKAKYKAMVKHKATNSYKINKKNKQENRNQVRNNFEIKYKIIKGLKNASRRAVPEEITQVTESMYVGLLAVFHGARSTGNISRCLLRRQFSGLLRFIDLWALRQQLSLRTLLTSLWPLHA